MAISPANAKQEAQSLLKESRSLLDEAMVMRDRHQDVLAKMGPEAEEIEERIRRLLEHSKRLSDLAKKLVS